MLATIPMETVMHNVKLYKITRNDLKICNFKKGNRDRK